MTLVNVPGSPIVSIGLSLFGIAAVPTISSTVLNAANAACIMIGRIVTSDGVSHTIDTTGLSKLEWRSGVGTFANAGTTVKVGLAAVDATTGPSPRAVNVADVITMDVSRSMIGGGGGIASNAWQSHVPTAGSKTIANGDLVAFCVQATARAGADSILVLSPLTSVAAHNCCTTNFTSGLYADAVRLPDCFITFSDGATGWFMGGDVASDITTQTYNNSSSPNEYGQLFQFGFPMKIHGIVGNADIDAGCDFVLYSDPLGTPVAQKTVAIDGNTTVATTGRRFVANFSSPYTVTAGQVFAAIAKPNTATNISTYFKTLNAAAHRVSDVWGTSGYGVSRSGGTGAFANKNSSLDHFYLGLLVGAFDDGAGRAVLINNPSLVA